MTQDKYRTSSSPNLKRLASAIGKEHKSVREIMENLGLKGRDSFLKLYLKSSLALGLTAMEFPDSPRHPKQRYYLTAKGLTLLKQ